MAGAIPDPGPPFPMPPEEWVDALETACGDAKIPDWPPSGDWAEWVDDLEDEAGRSLNVPRSAQFDNFVDWAQAFIGLNG